MAAVFKLGSLESTRLLITTSVEFTSLQENANWHRLSPKLVQNMPSVYSLLEINNPYLPTPKTGLETAVFALLTNSLDTETF